MVASGTRKAAAISAVPRPHTHRRVSATCTASASAGWQHMKISSSSSPASPAACGAAPGPDERARPDARAAGPVPPSSRAAASSFAPLRASRRTRSIALCRATPISQPRGLAGPPLAGHCASAARQASWTASSAMARSPTMRMTLATAGHQWARNVSSVRAAAAPGPPTGLPPSRSSPRESWPPTSVPRPGRRTRPACSRRPVP